MGPVVSVSGYCALCSHLLIAKVRPTALQPLRSESPFHTIFNTKKRLQSRGTWPRFVVEYWKWWLPSNSCTWGEQLCAANGSLKAFSSLMS